MKLRHTLIAFCALLAPFSLRPAAAAALRVASALGDQRAPQPGDVVEVAIVPAAGEKIVAIGMSAFDTPNVYFYTGSDGSARALVGFPFDRSSGSFPLKARVSIEKAGKTTQTVLTATMHAATRVYPTQYVTMNRKTAATMSDVAGLHAEKLHVQSTMGRSNPAPLWRSSWQMPIIGHATSSYGRRRYVNGKWWGQHNGMDIRAGTGTPVHATNDGRVVLSEHLPTLRGNCIVIDHGCNVFSIYMHLSQRIAKVGDVVKRGQLIGKVGATGFVTGPHLHFEMRIGWEPVDPAKIVKYGLRF